jgi:hypothetical protein
MNSGIWGLRIREFLSPIIPQFLNLTQYSIFPAFHYSICKRVTSVSSSVALHHMGYRAKRVRDDCDFD